MAIKAFTACAAAVAVALALALTLAQRDRAASLTLRIASGSMRPALAIGEVVHVDRSAYDATTPQVGDIVAFRAPAGAIGTTPVCGTTPVAAQACPRATASAGAQLFVKRVVAGPGDTISIVNGAVLRNGALEREPYASACLSGPACDLPEPITVPSGTWFLMGDDRPHSDDSRYWGPVPTAWIVGKVDARGS